MGDPECHPTVSEVPTRGVQPGLEEREAGRGGEERETGAGGGGIDSPEYFLGSHQPAA